MGKFDGVLLVSDFDDTLYSAGHGLGERNRKALQSFMAQGGCFTVATGRAYRTFRAYAPLVPMNAPTILSNGSALYDFKTNQMLEQTFLTERAPEDFAAVCERFPALGFEAYHGEEIYAYRPNAVTDAHMKKVESTYTSVERIDEIPLPWTKAIFQQEHELLRQVQPWFSARFPQTYEAIFSNPVYLEITARGSHKGGMVMRLAQRLGIDARHIYCAGDNQNDIPMLDCAAMAFAPGDCAQVVKEFGPHLVCSCDEGIMGDIVEILEKIYN